MASLIRKFLFFYIIIISSHMYSKPHESGQKGQSYLSICAMFQDEADYLREWIEYHRLLGVEHFYLYNNNSEDHFLEILTPYIKKGVVDLFDWSRPNKDDYWLDDQKRAYNDCLHRFADKTTWLAFIDIDEFIVPVVHSDLVTFLSEFDNQPYLGAIRINWQLYGSSHLKTLPKDKLLIESFVWKAPTYYVTDSVPHNGIIKSIIRPEAIKYIRAHEGDLKDNYYSYPPLSDGIKSRFQPIQVDKIRINHYWTRNEDFFYQVKIGRRLTYQAPEYLEVMLQKLKDLNQEKDTIMKKFVPKLRKRLKLDV